MVFCPPGLRSPERDVERDVEAQRATGQLPATPHQSRACPDCRLCLPLASPPMSKTDAAMEIYHFNEPYMIDLFVREVHRLREVAYLLPEPAADPTAPPRICGMQPTRQPHGRPDAPLKGRCTALHPHTHERRERFPGAGHEGAGRGHRSIRQRSGAVPEHRAFQSSA